MSAFIAVTRGPQVQPVILTEPCRIVAGRSSEAELELPNLEVSREHCAFHWDGTVCQVENLSAAHGTSVNGKRIDGRADLKEGDMISIGPVLCLFGKGEPPVTVHTAGDVHGAIIVRGKPSDRIIIDGELTLGRDNTCAVVLPDPTVSREHAKIRPTPKGCIVEDLNSTGGSFVNGHRFDKQELTVGDRLRIGPFNFQFDGTALIRASHEGPTVRANGIGVMGGVNRILDGVHLKIEPSSFVGIIGPSGHGKSTLLNALAGLRRPNDGKITIDGLDLYGSAVHAGLGYVPQDDIVHLELTVVQALQFSARLRLARNTPKLEIEKLVFQTIERLGLAEHMAKPIARLSGGQRKRVSVATEVLARPPILYLDEPSSGLDPAREFELMELLRSLADTGCTVVCTTHVLENAFLLDQINVIFRGSLVFQGKVDEVRAYFGVEKLAGLYNRLDERRELWRPEWERLHPPEPAESADKPPAKRAAAARLGTPQKKAFALPILLARQFAIEAADLKNFIILLGQPLIIAALVCWVSKQWQLVMFFAYLATLWFGCSNAAQVVVKEIAIFRRERLVGVGLHSYILSKVIFLGAISLLQAGLCYGTMYGWETFLRDKEEESGPGGSVLWQIVSLIGTAAAAVGIGTAISSIAKTVVQAVMIVPLILIPMIVFSGFTVPPSDMSPSVRFVSKLMPSYSSQTLMDTSFLWHEKIEGRVASDFSQSYTNLRKEVDFDDQQPFKETAPAKRALLVLLGWTAITYFVSWFSLRKQG